MTWFANLMKPLARGVADLSPSCKEAARLQSAALDRKLSLRQQFGLRVHLVLCKWCRRYGRQITFLRNAAREHPNLLAGPIPQKLSPEARARISKRLHADRD